MVQPTSPRYSLINDIQQRRAANTLIPEAGTKKCDIFLDDDSSVIKIVGFFWTNNFNTNAYIYASSLPNSISTQMILEELIQVAVNEKYGFSSSIQHQHIY